MHLRTEGWFLKQGLNIYIVRHPGGQRALCPQMHFGSLALPCNYQQMLSKFYARPGRRRRRPLQAFIASLQISNAQRCNVPGGVG